MGGNCHYSSTSMQRGESTKKWRVLQAWAAVNQGATRFVVGIGLTVEGVGTDLELASPAE